MNNKEIKLRAVTALEGPKRYSHFIKVAADERMVWGLYQDGWALAGDSNGSEAFALWPAREYASQCATDAWEGYEPREIDIDTLFEILLPKLRLSKTAVAVFPTPGDKGVLPSLEVFESDLRHELSRIE